MDTNRMNDDLQKKIDGHFEELKGKLTQATGHQFKGGMSVLKGKMENAIADDDIATQDINEQIKHDIEIAKKKVNKDIKLAFT